MRLASRAELADPFLLRDDFEALRHLFKMPGHQRQRRPGATCLKRHYEQAIASGAADQPAGVPALAS
jgi:hypothetical protein